MQQALYADVLVNLRPVDSLAGADETLPLSKQAAFLHLQILIDETGGQPAGLDLER